jgi:mono/diheme cytochrome c family protein
MRLSINELKTVVGVAMTISILALVLFSQTSSQAASAAVGDGAETYKAKCASCHGADGTGQTTVGKALKVRDLTSADVQTQTDDQLYDIVAKGKGKMPGYEKTLGADKCKELVAFIRTLKK